METLTNPIVAFVCGIAIGAIASYILNRSGKSGGSSGPAKGKVNQRK